MPSEAEPFPEPLPFTRSYTIPDESRIGASRRVRKTFGIGHETFNDRRLGRADVSE